VLAELVEDVSELYRRKFDGRKLRFTAAVPTDLVVNGVAGELRQVIANLLANAIVAAPTGGNVKVDGGATASGCELVVSDDGNGVPQQLVSRLFEPFFTTKTDVGTGLGLWVSQKIAQKHGGNLRYERHNGATRFVLEIPKG
jgi:signal transduction histidine kinase